MAVLQKINRDAECGEDDIAEPARIIERVLEMIDGKWKVLIVMHLTVNKVCRFGELRRRLPNITQRMLTLQLREMEMDGLVTRRVYAEVPPRVEYTLTEVGRDLKSIYQSMHRWGLRHPEAKRVSEVPRRRDAKKR
jgi:DNA-binding HxlR family transcriptional regulator